MAVVARLSGGLGNQLFQFAAGVTFASRLETDLFVDPSGIDFANQRETATHREFLLPNLFPSVRLLSPAIFSPNSLIRLALRHGKSPGSTLASNLAYRLDGRKKRARSLYRDRDLEDLLSLPSEILNQTDIHLNGYWSDFRIAEMGSAEILSLYRPAWKGSQRLMKIKSQMTQSRSTAVHVRRGDFLSDWASHHHVTTKEYFNSAMDTLAKSTDRFFVFSDDIDWCISNISQKSKEVSFVHIEKGETDADHLTLMSSALNFVISNSSFSWWAAWLGQHSDKKVIRPLHWIKGDSGSAVYPSGWLPLTSADV